MSARATTMAVLLAAAPAPAVTAPQDPPYLRIDGVPISADAYGRWLLEVEGERQARSFARDSWVIRREAERLGLSTHEEQVVREVDAQFQERIEGAFRGSAEAWRDELSRTRRSEAGVRRQRSLEVRSELDARAIAALDRVVPEFLIEREWERRWGRKGRRYDLRMMRFGAVVPSWPDMTREEWKARREAVLEEARGKALSARERVLAGADFGLVAARESDDPETRDRRGSPPGGFQHVGWPNSFFDALEGLDPGQVSEPLYARGGWWIVEVRSVAVTPLERVRAGIEADLVARGPEPYEVGIVRSRLAEGIEVRALPALLEPGPESEWPSALEPVLQIDGEPVARGEYARWLFDTAAETFVDTFVEEWLVRRMTREEGIEIDPQQAAERTSEYVRALVDRGYHGDRQAWVAYLELGGRSEEALVRGIRRRMEVDLLTEALYVRERAVRPEDVRLRFLDEFGPEGRRIEVRMILLAIRPPELPPDLGRDEVERRMREASEATRRRAVALVERARGGEDFAQLARATSEDPRSSDLGGALPGRFRGDQWPEAIAGAVAALRAGEVGEPMLHGGAWLIFQVASERRVAFEEVREELEAELRAERPSAIELAAHRNALAKAARVERLPLTPR